MPQYKNACKVCGAEIISYMSYKQVCSKACRDIADRNYAKEHMRAVRKGYKIICVRCKKEFSTSDKTQNVCFRCLVYNLNR